MYVTEAKTPLQKSMNFNRKTAKRLKNKKNPSRFNQNKSTQKRKKWKKKKKQTTTTLWSPPPVANLRPPGWISMEKICIPSCLIQLGFSAIIFWLLKLQLPALFYLLLKHPRESRENPCTKNPKWGSGEKSKLERPEEEKGTCNLGKVENWVIFTEGILWLKRKRVL